MRQNEVLGFRSSKLWRLEVVVRSPARWGPSVSIRHSHRRLSQRAVPHPRTCSTLGIITKAMSRMMERERGTLLPSSTGLLFLRPKCTAARTSLWRDPCCTLLRAELPFLVGAWWFEGLCSSAVTCCIWGGVLSCSHPVRSPVGQYAVLSFAPFSQVSATSVCAMLAFFEGIHCN